jgi:hypothetical protein
MGHAGRLEEFVQTFDYLTELDERANLPAMRADLPMSGRRRSA